jgi:hypothetical protein
MANKKLVYETFASNAQTISSASQGLTAALEAAAASMNNTLNSSTGTMADGKSVDWADINAQINAKIGQLNTLLANTQRAANETNEYEVTHKNISETVQN